jgi:hypothetical protein
VDLVLALDTSGSLFHSFNQQRQIGLDLLSSLLPSLLNSTSTNVGPLRLGIVSFAAEPSLVLSLQERVGPEEMLHRLRGVQFTGRSTRIGDAIEMALEQFEANGRQKATKVNLHIYSNLA